MTDVALARSTLEAEKLAFVLVREGRILARGTESGVIELLRTVDRLGPAVRGASLADKVIGKAVALIVANVGIVQVYTALASQGAIDFLRAQQIPLEPKAVVPLIVNRRGDGPCPMERATLPYDDPAEGMRQLRAFFAARDAAERVQQA